MSDWRAMMRGSYSPTQYPQNPQKDLSGGHSEDIEDFEEGQTDKPDILADHGTVSVLSVPVSGIPTEISATQTDGSPLVPSPQYPQNPQNGSGVELGPRPEPPLCPGWKVAFRNQGQLQDGIVSRCDGTGSAGTVHLTNGTALPLKWVTSVGKTDATGKVIAAWLTSRHRFDGERGAS